MSGVVGVGVSPGNVPVHHGPAPNPMVLERRVRAAELLLRVSICALAAAAAFITATDTQVRVIFTLEKKASYKEMKSMVFLVVAMGMMACYSLLQVVRCAVGMLRGSVLFSKPVALFIFSGDQLMAYLSMAAVAAALQSSAIAKLGQPELQWVKVCVFFERYCNQGAGGMISAVLASLCAALTSPISAYTFFRLFGENKGKSSGASW